MGRFVASVYLRPQAVYQVGTRLSGGAAGLRGQQTLLGRQRCKWGRPVERRWSSRALVRFLKPMDRAGSAVCQPCRCCSPVRDAAPGSLTCRWVPVRGVFGTPPSAAVSRDVAKVRGFKMEL